jgi:apolipoprotein N-acyltransferase
MLKFRLSPPLAALAAVIAGAVAALGFEPVNWWPLTIIGVAVLIALIDAAASRRRAALLGWLFGTGHFVAGLGWIATAFTFQSKMPPMLGWVTVVLLSMFLAIYAGLAAGIARAIARTPLGRVLVFAALWMLGEWLRGWVLSGFAWNPLGAAWLAAPGVAQLAAIGGALTLSGLMVLAGGGLWLLIRAPSASSSPGALLERLAGAGFVLLVVIAGLLGSGVADTYYLPGSPQVFLVQPNIGQEEKYSEGAEDAHLQTYLDLTASALAGAAATPEDVVGKPAAIEPLAVADFSEPTAVAASPAAASASPSTPAATATSPAPAQVEAAAAAAPTRLQRAPGRLSSGRNRRCPMPSRRIHRSAPALPPCWVRMTCCCSAGLRSIAMRAAPSLR